MELPSLVETLAQDWSLTIGPPLCGGHLALVVDDQTHSVRVTSSARVDVTEVVLRWLGSGLDVDGDAEGEDGGELFDSVVAHPDATVADVLAEQ